MTRLLQLDVDALTERDLAMPLAEYLRSLGHSPRCNHEWVDVADAACRTEQRCRKCFARKTILQPGGRDAT